jgi:flagellar biosynthesis/type III secretory pathway chaperone
MKLSNIWKDFCIYHSNLLDATFTEYEILLSSDLEDLDEVNAIKKEFINRISSKEMERKILLAQAFEDGILTSKISSLSELEDGFAKYESNEKIEYFSEFSSLLKSIMVNLKLQNKKNQIYINKALNSLSNLKEEMAGKKSTQIYNPKGETSRLKQES